MPILIKYAPHLVLLIALVGGTAYLHHRWVSQGEATGRAIAEEALRERDTAISALRASQKASEGYANELETLRNTRRPDPVVRVCSAAKPVSVPRPAAGTDGPATPAGDVSGEPGRDIGPDLARLTERADALAAQLRALQEWVKAVGPTGQP